MLKTLMLLALLPVATLFGQGTVNTISLTGSAVAIQTGSNYNFTIAGSGSVTGFGNAQLSGSGVFDLGTVVTLGPINGTMSLIFPDGDVLLATFSIPPGVLIPQLGGTVGATGSVKIIGGSGKFAGASGSFTGVSGSGTITGSQSTSFQLSGTGTVSAPAALTPGTLTYRGSIAHIAAGAGWKTTFTLVNTGTTTSQVRLAFFDESGAALSLPVSYPQTPATPAAPASTIDRNLAVGAVLIVESQGGDALLLGSAQISTDGAATGSAIFRYTPSGQEAVVPLETRNPGSFVLPFDNTGGYANGLAISNVASTAASVKILIGDDTGTNNIVTDTLTIPARGHISFVLSDKYSLTALRRGTVTLQTPANGQISALGIRATAAGAYTSIPPGVK